jgi:hypothetical protein
MERFHCLEESTETIDVLIESAYGDGELSQITQSVMLYFNNSELELFMKSRMQVSRSYICLLLLRNLTV